MIRCNVSVQEHSRPEQNRHRHAVGPGLVSGALWTSETVELRVVLSGHALIKDLQKSQARVDISIMKSLYACDSEVKGIIM